MAAGDLEEIRAPEGEEDEDDIPDDLLGRFGLEFIRIEDISSLLNSTKESIERIEEQCKFLKQFLTPLLAVSIFAPVIALTASVTYFASQYDFSGSLQVAYYVFLGLMTVIVLLCVIPTFLNSYWSSAEELSRNQTCYCTHKCHSHFGFTHSSESEERTLAANPQRMRFVEVIRGYVLSILLFIASAFAIPLYVCDLCEKNKSSARRVCHCHVEVNLAGNNSTYHDLTDDEAEYSEFGGEEFSAPTEDLDGESGATSFPSSEVSLGDS